MLASTIALTALSGCTSASNEEHAQKAVDEISEDLEVNDWAMNGETLEIEYVTTGSITADLEIVGDAYADAVSGGAIRSGLGVELEATAVGASNEFTFTIPRKLAKEYADGQVTQEEYINEIADF